MSLSLDKDFDFEKLQLFSESDNELHATLISSNLNHGEEKAVLYLHGYIDYFFHPHVADAFHANKFDFFALDLRRYGRSLLSYQKPNYCESIEEYFEEITLALKIIKKRNKKIYLLGHSTGGLVASCYLNRGEEKESISGLLLNSPFLDMAQSKFLTNLMYSILKPLSTLFPNGRSNKGLSPIYAESMHKEYHGEWDFNLSWKPINGYPVYFKWFVAIVDGQRSLELSNINVPILLMHSKHSVKPIKHGEEVQVSDAVLDIEDMKRIGPKLGRDVTLVSIDNGVHDLFLSSKRIREKAFSEMFSWLKKI